MSSSDLMQLLPVCKLRILVNPPDLKVTCTSRELLSNKMYM